MGWRNLRIILDDTNPLDFDKPRDSLCPWEWQQEMLRRDGLTSNAEVTIDGAPDVYELRRDSGARTVITRDSPRAPMGYNEYFSMLVDIKRASNAQTIYEPQGPLPRWADYQGYPDDF